MAKAKDLLVGEPYLVTWLDAAFYFDTRPEEHGEICRTLGFFIGRDHKGDPLFAMESAEPFEEDTCRGYMAIPEGMVLEAILIKL